MQSRHSRTPGGPVQGLEMQDALRMPNRGDMPEEFRVGPRQALRGGIQKSIFKDVPGNLGTSQPKLDKWLQERVNGSKNEH